MKKHFILAVSLLAAAPLAATAGPVSGDKSVTLSGTGSSDKKFDGNSFGVSGEFGYYGSDQWLYGVRQSVSGVVGDDVKDAWDGSTRLFADYHFGSGALRPFLGANIGALYGKNVRDTGTAGIEGGLKYYVLEKTFISVGVEYAFLFRNTNDVDKNFNDGAFFYNLGVGFNF